MYYDASLFENALFTVVEAYNKAIDACYLRRKEITQELKTAREIGDLYDNPAYDAAREKQQINELRVSCYRSIEQVVNMFRDIEENSPDELSPERIMTLQISLMRLILIQKMAAFFPLSIMKMKLSQAKNFTNTIVTWKRSSFTKRDV